MRIYLALQGIQPGLKQKARLLFQLARHAHSIPYLQGYANNHGCGCTDRNFQRQIPVAQRKVAMRIKMRHKAGSRLQDHQQHQQQHLPVQVRTPQVAPNPAVHAKVNKRREHIFHIDKAVKCTRYAGNEQVHRQGQVLAMQHCRQCQKHGTGHRCRRSDDDAQQYGALK